MLKPVFLTREHILHIHQSELDMAGGMRGIRDSDAIDACVSAPMATYGGEYLHDLFEMATAYVVCLSIRHPFMDGNKRAALATGLTFLFLNGLIVTESYETELADLLLKFLRKDSDKLEIIEYLRHASTPRD